MRIASLEAFGVPTPLLAVWETELSTELLPIQERAVVQHKLLAGNNLLVQAPTSAGKTFVGEMAATRAALAGRKVLYLVPTKALAEDKFAHFQRLYSPLGVRLIACTRDRRGDDARFLSGDFDIAVAIPEKVRALWARGGVSQFLGLAVLDELQTMSDPDRGPCLELLLAQLRSLANLQIIGLSACLGTSPQLAEYLQAGWLETDQRPVELRKGVLVGEEFRYRDPSGSWSIEHFAGAGIQEGDTYAEASVRLAVHFAQAGEQTIVFVRDRAGATRLAATIAERLDPATAEHDCDLGGLERTAARQRLQSLSTSGVGFHSSDLQFEDRKRVEAAFAAGELMVLCATPTLALGVNLPARNVIIDPQGWQSETAGSPSALSPLTRGDYENRAGRAGRLGYGGFGRAIMLADGELSGRSLTARYLEADFANPDSALAGLPPLQAVLSLAGAAAATGISLSEMYTRTYSAHLLRHCALPEPLQNAARQCSHQRLLQEESDGHFLTTPLGRISSGAGISFDTLRWLVRWVEQAERPPTEVEATLMATLTAEAHAGVSFSRRPALDHCQALRHLSDAECEAGPLLERLLTTEERDWRERDQAARLTLALWRWMGPEETHEVEAAVRMSAARLLALGETAGWIVDTLAEIGAEAGWPLAHCQRLRKHAECLALGLGAEALPLGRLRVFGLGRDHVRALVRSGVQTPEEALQAGAQRLSELIPPEVARELLSMLERRQGWHDRSRGSLLPHGNVGPSTGHVKHGRKTDHATRSDHPVLEETALVLSADRPDLAVYYGQNVALRPAEFRLLRMLAENPGKCIRYDTLYNYMWDGDRLVEPGQIYSHRSRLCGKLAIALPERDPKKVVVTVPRHGLMLNLRKEEVKVS
ncbi:MAG: DEAD/DEAH box helicase [Armatimonadota bacterium]